MNKRKQSVLKLLITAFLLLLILSIIFFTFFFISSVTRQDDENFSKTQNKSYHVLIIGSNDNELFLKQVYQGALNYQGLYDTVVELYVPQSHAEDLSSQSLFEYASFLNVDGIIAYISTPEEQIDPIEKIDGTPIPVVTIGQFSASTNQVSYVGSNYWELGTLFGSEIISKIKNNTIAIIQAPSNINNINYSNLTNALMAKIKDNTDITCNIVNNVDEILLQSVKNNDIILVGLTEADTIRLAQLYNETKSSKNITIIGFGNNETCQSYLSKGTIKSLISQNPTKVGEAAIRELIEYRNRGNANSYVVSELMINRGVKDE